MEDRLTQTTRWAGLVTATVATLSVLTMANGLSEREPHHNPVQPVATPSDMTGRNVTCLAKNVYHEARGEAVNGQIAVAQVTLNRARGKYDGDVCAAVYEHAAFSWTLDRHEPPIKDSGSWAMAWRVAQSAYLGRVPNIIGALTHYYNPHLVHPAWARRPMRQVQIGNHRFVEPREPHG